jgi:HCOMODA/2-hydroxy-3-carboxy-muconic semialdehyde decarboxylase
MRLMPCGCLCLAGGLFQAGAVRSPVDAPGARKAAPTSRGPVEAPVLDDLAAASRILSDQGVVDAFGHVSMRHPHAPDRFLMSRSLAPALVQPDDILEYDLDAEPCDARGRSSFLERFIHGEIYKARPDVMSIVHSHSPSVIPFGLVATPMRAMFHNAAFLAGGVPVFDIRDKFGATDMLVGNHSKGTALAEVLADKPVVLMRAHGSVAVGPSLAVAVFRAVYTEVNARLQVQASMLGGPIAALDSEEGVKADGVNLTSSARAWDLWKRRVSVSAPR